MDEREAAIVRRVFDEFVSGGLSYSAIAKLLNADGIRARKGGKWAPRVVRVMITSENVRGGSHHPAIIDEATWRDAARLTERNSKYAPKGSSGRIPKSHVFIRGTLRCGLCGEAMLPRSDRHREWYACRTRTELGGASACPMPILRRDRVDLRALDLFQTWGLDVDGTRREVAEQLDGRAAVARSEAERAVREIALAKAALDRADADYASGELGPVAYDRQLSKHAESIEAAEAEHARLAAHADELRATRANLDAEAETLRRLAELRAAIAERVGGAEARDLNALRAAIAAVFRHVVVAPESRIYALSDPAPDSTLGELHARLDAPPSEEEFEAAVTFERSGDRWHVVDDDSLALVPVVREEMLRETRNAVVEPIRRISLGIAANKGTGTQVLDQIRTRSA